MTNYILIQYPKYIFVFIVLLTLISVFLLLNRRIEKLENKWKNNYDDILREKNSTIKQLKALRWSPFYYRQSKHLKQAISLKLKCQKLDVTMLNATMSSQQLYLTNNPLWARGYSIREIEVVLTLQTYSNNDLDIIQFLNDNK